MSQTAGNPFLVIERILRDRDGIWTQVVEERGLKDLTIQMLISSAVSLAIYGAVLGASNGFAQSAVSLIKLPLLFLATLAICLPTLYLFNLIFGAKLSMLQAVTLIMAAITVISVLALAFAPISLFFLISADNYSFFKILNVSILVLAAVVGLRFLTSGMAALNDHQQKLARLAREQEAALAVVPAQSIEEPELALVGAPAETNGVAPQGVALPAAPPVRSWATNATAARVVSEPRPASMTLLYIWIALFGFVGTQLAWTLRPFFGSPGEPFALFREIDGTFYGDLFATFGRLFGG